MPPAVTAEEHLAQLTTLTGLSPTEWQDFLACTPAQQALIADSYKHLSWAQSPDTLGEVLAVLNVLGTIAGVVGGVAGAASAVVALKGML